VVAAGLSEEGLFVSHGHFYAPEAIAVLGAKQKTLVRAGCAAYTSMEEMERLVDGVRRLMTDAHRNPPSGSRKPQTVEAP
jgi:selenocysteine lyase/cysteine desulfurase